MKYKCTSKMFSYHQVGNQISGREMVLKGASGIITLADVSL